MFAAEAAGKPAPVVNLLGMLTTDCSGFEHLLLNNVDMKIQLRKNKIEVSCIPATRYFNFKFSYVYTCLIFTFFIFLASFGGR